MVKTDAIARRILGWKLNRWDRWFDYEKGKFIHDADFQPEENLNHAMLVVERLEELGFSYSVNESSRVCFNGICGTGETLPQAITNAAYSIIEHHSISNSTKMWQKLC
ncbi:BC1872 family protein [Neobacillus mesonae]|uniref:BC1872 family protein n=1 Tax=Neobacillus mesonae TaxID=1193713 RepID=UPI00203C71B8|nr:hypothetical protein [Neobacillus mesonae]MCM3571086.1 hypothetical protein [Neobacillus mesonae]